MIKCAIIGVSGYTGLELVKILLNHPSFELAYAANTEGGVMLSELHSSLLGVCDMLVAAADADAVKQSGCELAFLALPHKAAMGFAKELLALGVKVVDLSADYRISLEAYEKAYTAHLDKENLTHAVYGLPEFFRERVKNATLVANPGCYPTASVLALAPFLPYIDESAPIFVDAKSGVSGAGKKCEERTHFVTANENLFAYSPLTHRHTPEILEKLQIIGQKELQLNFVPHLLPITRGMMVSAYATLKRDIEPMQVLSEFYKNEQFVRVRNEPVQIKNVAGTNFCDIFAMRNGKALFVNSAIDNLLRGASSQAVVNANIMFGLSEDAGIPKIAYAP